MAPVAERHVLRVLAGAPRHRLGFRNLNFLWPELGAFMRAIAERLALGSPTGTPPIHPGFNFLHNR